jgi:hypothetical protein
LKQSYHKLLSTFAINFNLRRYTEAATAALEKAMESAELSQRTEHEGASAAANDAHRARAELQEVMLESAKQQRGWDEERQGLTLVYFPGQPEPSLSLKP